MVNLRPPKQPVHEETRVPLIIASEHPSRCNRLLALCSDSKRIHTAVVNTHFRPWGECSKRGLQVLVNDPTMRCSRLGVLAVGAMPFLSRFDCAQLRHVCTQVEMTAGPYALNTTASITQPMECSTSRRYYESDVGLRYFLPYIRHQRCGARSGGEFVDYELACGSTLRPAPCPLQAFETA